MTVIPHRCGNFRPDRQSQIYPSAVKMPSNEASKVSSSEKISNVNYEADIKHTLGYTRCFLGLLGLWPMASKNSTKFEKSFSKLLILVCTISPACVMIPTTHYMILREKNMIARLVLFTPIGFAFANFVKYVFIVLRCETIKLCIEHVKTDWMRIENESDRTIMRRNIKVGHHLTVVCSLFMYSCGLSYHTVMPLRIGKTINEFNETVRPLIYPGFDTFVNSHLSPTYEIVFCTIWVSAFVAYTVTVTTCNLAAIFVTHACGQIQVLVSRLEGLVQEINGDESTSKISQRISLLIQCHVRVLRLASNIEVILREICLIEVVASTFTICLLEYCFMMEWDNSGIVGIITYLMSLISLSFNIYVFCHIGELLKDQYNQVGAAAYMIDWYRLPGNIGLDLVMIIIMASCPRKITAGRMIELTITSFGNIIKMSVTYFNMLRQLTH